MEKVRDLLNRKFGNVQRKQKIPTCNFLASRDNLPIHEDKQKGIYVKDLLEVYVGSSDEVYEVMRRGGNNRVVAYTSKLTGFESSIVSSDFFFIDMNAESSRSHSIFVITITQKNVDTGAAKSGKLYLVDLAGSEKVKPVSLFA